MDIKHVGGGPVLAMVPEVVIMETLNPRVTVLSPVE